MFHLLLGNSCDPLGMFERVVDLRVVVVTAGQFETQVHDLEFRLRRQLLGIHGRFGAHDLIGKPLETVIEPFGFLLCFRMMNRQCAGGRTVFIFQFNFSYVGIFNPVHGTDAESTAHNRYLYLSL